MIGLMIMKEENIKKLNKELRFLLEEERKKEITKYDLALNDEKVEIKKIAKDVYQSRGIDYQKLDKGLFNNIMNTINDLRGVFANKDAKIRKKMIWEIIYTVLILILLKLPFDLIRDIGYNYIEILTTNHLLENIWEFVFLLMYTITFICAFIVLIRNFNQKYQNINENKNE